MLLAILAALAALGAVAADIVHRSNVARVAHYQDDALCWAPLSAPIEVKGSPCRVETAEVTARWIALDHGTTSMHLAIRTTDGLADSVELKGADNRDLWDGSVVGTSLLVQRFKEPFARRHHVTVVQNNGLVSRTQWNPTWRVDDAALGTTVCAVIAVAALIALLGMRVRRKREEVERKLFLQVFGEPSPGPR
jgi:hypothetical protein